MAQADTPTRMSRQGAARTYHTYVNWGYFQRLMAQRRCSSGGADVSGGDAEMSGDASRRDADVSGGDADVSADVSGGGADIGSDRPHRGPAAAASRSSYAGARVARLAPVRPRAPGRPKAAEENIPLAHEPRPARLWKAERKTVAEQCHLKWHRAAVCGISAMQTRLALPTAKLFGSRRIVNETCTLGPLVQPSDL